MVEYAAYIDVPESDISEGRVYAAKQDSAETEAQFPPLSRVHNGASKPDDAFVAVSYRDHCSGSMTGTSTQRLCSSF